MATTTTARSEHAKPHESRLRGDALQSLTRRAPHFNRRCEQNLPNRTEICLPQTLTQSCTAHACLRLCSDEWAGCERQASM